MNVKDDIREKNSHCGLYYKGLSRGVSLPDRP